MKKETENIFSFKKKEEKSINQIVPIIVDSREKNAMILANLYEQKAKLEIKKLEIGDYLVGEILIERKTKTDLIHSLKSNRLKDQIKNMKQHKKPLFIIEEDHNEFSMQHTNIIEGILLSIAAHHQIPIIQTESEKHTAKVLLKIAKKEKKQSKINHQKIPKTKQEQKRFILEAFPGVGAKTSKDLLEHFTSLKDVFTVDPKIIEDLTNKKIAENFRELLN